MWDKADAECCFVCCGFIVKIDSRQINEAPKYFCIRCVCPHKKQEVANTQKRKKKRSDPVLAVALEYVLNTSVRNQSAQESFYL